MPLRQLAVWCGLALLCGAAAGLVRAAVPENPLRPAPARSDSPAIQPEPLAHSLVSAEAQVSEPASVVPEMLPAPAGDYDAAAPLHYPIDEADLFSGLVPAWLAEPWFAHSDPNDPHRHIGLGQPLIGTSWRNRPWYVGTFIGGVLLGELQSDVHQNDTSFLGLRLGIDFDHYWGFEGRWAFARPQLFDGADVPLDGPSRDYFTDFSLAWYPLGDARWRPYVVAGVGFQTFRFHNDLDQRISETIFSVPIGFGVKYFYGPWCSLRFDFVDNIAFGNERVSAANNIGLMAGVEYRFGGRRQSYFPWHNNTSYW